MPVCQVLPPQDLLFEGPRGAPFWPGSLLMQLHHHAHRGKKPAMRFAATHPTGLQVKNVLDEAVQRLYRRAPLLVEVRVFFLREHFDHVVAFGIDDRSLAWGGQPQQPPWSSSRAKHILLIGLAVHESRGNQALEFARLPPQAVSFVCTVAHPLERSQDATRPRHHTERPMAIDPAVTLAVTPGGLGVQPRQACRDEPLLLVLTMPDRPTRPHHHLVGADDVSASGLVKQFDQGILPPFQARSRFFLNALGADSRSSGAG